MSVNDKKSKNKLYVLNYRNKQKTLGRRARLLYLSNEEYEQVKEVIAHMRQTGGGVDLL